MANLEVPNCIVVDQNDPTIVFYEKNADVKSVPGSTMKIMTCILAIELCEDLEQKVVVTGQAAALKETNSLMGVIRGESLSVRELLYGLMLESGNDAALLLAITFGGTVEGFAELMNAKAAEIGMVNTHFVNSSGAYKSGQYSTARDMAILTCYALKNEMFRTLVSTVHYTIQPNDVRKHALEMTNSNKLLSDPAGSDLFYEYATGVKTGSTGVGGKCLVGSASKDGAGVVAVMLGVTEGGSKLARMSQVYRDTKAIMDLALTTRYVTLTPKELGIDASFTADVEGGTQSSVSAVAAFTPESVRLPDVIAEKIKADPSLLMAEINVPRAERARSGGRRMRNRRIFLQRHGALYRFSYGRRAGSRPFRRALAHRRAEFGPRANAGPRSQHGVWISRLGLGASRRLPARRRRCRRAGFAGEKAQSAQAQEAPPGAALNQRGIPGGNGH